MLKEQRQKVKIRVSLDEEVVQYLKERATKEGRTISDVIEDAMLQYEKTSQLEMEMRLKSLERFLSSSINLPAEDWKAIMEEDVYDQ